jgi:long-subunit acyl-CoA synthetase (AMP-forming)
MEYNTPLDMLYKWEAATPDKVYMRQPIDGIWHTWTWKQTADEVRRMASVLKARNLPAGSHIALVSKNCAHWIMCDLAIMMAGHVSIPLYPNLNDKTIRQILEHSEAKLLFVGKLDDWSVLKPGVPEGLPCISFPFYPHKEYDQWDDLIKQQQPHADTKRDGKELATIVYTSGTTGLPKGAMHKFHNLGFAATNAVKHLKIDATARFFSYLPLSHVAERLLVEHGSLYTGGEVSFAESLDTFAQNLQHARPTVFLGVHRIWTKFQQGILAKLPQSRLNILLKIPIVSGLIKKKIKAGLGFQDAANIFTGASPTPVALMQWFDALGIRIQEAYATTENCCYSHVTKNDHVKFGFVGQNLPLCETKLGPDKEILIKHEGLMDGYFKEPQLTAESFNSEGFLHTGDEGFIDSEGFLKITGRVKDLFKTAKGKYVAPSPIEMQLSGDINIGQVCVVGSAMPQPMAMVILSDTAKTKPRPEMAAELEANVRALNKTLDHHERIQKIIVLADDWTVENGLLTPSLKIKRNEVERKYEPQYEKWYAGKETVVWVG